MNRREEMVAVGLDGLRWRKSSWSSGHADPEQTDCVEVAMVDTDAWRKSSPVTGQSDPGNEDSVEENRVEVAVIDTATTAPFAALSFAAVRDSKNPGHALVFPLGSWSGLLDRLLC